MEERGRNMIHKEDVTEEMMKLFKTDWNKNVKIVQKDIHYLNRNKTTVFEDDDNTTMLYINTVDVFGYNLTPDNIDTNVTESDDFQIGFNSLCKMVVDRDFEMFREENDHKEWLEQFVNEYHGSGVTALFWLYYNLMLHKDVNNIAIDNLDGLLHPSSRVALANVFNKILDKHVIMLMNADDLFSTQYTEIEDMYVAREDGFKNVRECTDRELRISHNFSNLLRAGEFNL